MKKIFNIIACVLVLGLFGTDIQAVTAQKVKTIAQKNIDRLQREYDQFKSAMRCLRKGGWKNCDDAQKKRIVIAGVALAIIVTATIAIIGVPSYKYLTKISPEDEANREVVYRLNRKLKEEKATYPRDLDSEEKQLIVNAVRDAIENDLTFATQISVAFEGYKGQLSNEKSEVNQYLDSRLFYSNIMVGPKRKGSFWAEVVSDLVHYEGGPSIGYLESLAQEKSSPRLTQANREALQRTLLDPSLSLSSLGYEKFIFYLKLMLLGEYLRSEGKKNNRDLFMESGIFMESGS